MSVDPNVSAIGCFYHFLFSFYGSHRSTLVVCGSDNVTRSEGSCSFMSFVGKVPVGWNSGSLGFRRPGLEASLPKQQTGITLDTGTVG